MKTFEEIISVADEEVRIASTEMMELDMKVRYRLGVSGTIKINELSKYQIDQVEQMIG